ncbi:hypothetical protein R69658_04243 [Paraburkholderia aspalathi]|uniref:P2 phage tail completion protein R (GpR) n=1 Tax=Paraburkholderia aspalathi TaxID=1324617 RepID=A0ABN7M8X7_9BURK|nr:phage tail protein [Paraburkholderia aspalathi]MBK3820720.1 phage tail protein [Paraburkholderia aspalathi]MBK3832514.1 phage tail protein [Paraburkholderia aspalathi]MBK3862279.1 phage tail protein [Paraburkholderia aspalathi]CAE6784775.1 hypothetical protein R69658_04243 [Paraburkholderia aspalathi]
MNKAATFRRAIADAVPELHDDPDKLLVFVDAGNVIATAAPSLSFEYRYTLNAIVTDFAGDADAVFVALIAWVQRNQSDLLANPDERQNGIAFEVDHLTQTTCDLSIKLKLTESVVVRANADGSNKITHVDEPVPEWNVHGLVDPSWTS